MATQLFLLSTPATTHRSSNSAKLAGAASGWMPRALGLSRGSGMTASGATATVTGATAGVEVTDGTFPYEWLSNPVAADVTISGTITANIWCAESSMSANVAINVIVDIVRNDSADTIVQIVKSTRITEEATTTRAAANFTTGMTSGSYTAQTLQRGDRLRVRVFGDDAGAMATGFTFNASFAGTTAAADGDSYVTFTENISFDYPPGTTDSPVIVQTTGDTQSFTIGSVASQEKVAQSFIAVGSMTRVRLYLGKIGAPTDNLVVELQSDSGSDAPSGSVLASASMAATGISELDGVYEFALSYATAAGTKYWLVVSRSGGLDSANRCKWYYSPANPYANGYTAVYNGTAWVAFTSNDMNFTVYGTVPALSGSTIYLTDTASDVSTASVDREAWTSRGSGAANDVTNTAAGFGAPIQVTDSAGGTVVDWFTKQLQAVTLSGLAQMNIRAFQSAAAANATIRVEIARVNSDGTSPTVWASWCMSADNSRTGELNTTETAETVYVSGDTLAITAGQRLRVRLYIDDMPTTAMGAGQTVTTYYGGTSAGASGDSYITFSQTLAVSGPTTHLGAATVSLVAARTTAGRKQTFGIVTRSETVAVATAGTVRQTHLGAAAVAAVVAVTAAGNRKALGATAVAELVTIATAGVRKALGAAAVALSAARTTAATRRTFGSSAVAETATVTTAGEVSGGAVDHVGAATVAVTVTATTAGCRRTTSTVAVSQTVTRTSAARITAKATVSRPETVTVSTSGEVAGKVYGAAAVQLQATVTSAGRRTTRSSSAVQLTAQPTSSARLTAKGAVARPETITVTTNGSSAGNVIGSAAVTLQTTIATAGLRYKVGLVAVTETVTVQTDSRTASVGIVTVPVRVQVTSSAEQIDALPPGLVLGPTTGRIGTASAGQLAQDGAGAIDQPDQGTVAGSERGLVSV